MAHAPIVVVIISSSDKDFTKSKIVIEVLIFIILECHQTLRAMMINYTEWVNKPLYEKPHQNFKYREL